MGDKVKIPRSFADDIGVADANASLRRHYMNIPIYHPLNNTTTGDEWGANSNTTGIPIFARNATLEKIFVTGFKRTTVNAKTTLLYCTMRRDGASTVFTFVMTNSTTLGERQHAWSTAARLPNVTSTSKLHLRVITRNQMTRLNFVMRFRERVDS